MASQWHKHNRHNDFIPLDYGLNIINSLEENAIVFTNGDNDTFPVWYVQAVRDRKAIEHIYPATDVYPTERTQYLIQRGLNWKNSHLDGIRQDVVVANLSLLNTPWYLKQLRDMDSIELNWTDDQIDRIRPFRSQTSLTISVESPNGDSFTITHPAGTILSVRDIAVGRIIQDNFGTRPIYFAVTCSDFSGFDDFLVNEGMVKRVVSTPGENRINYERLSNNLNNVFSFRSIFDDKAYKDNNMIRLLFNYSAALLRLSDHYLDIDDKPAAIRYHERALDFILSPPDRRRIIGMLPVYYAEVGRLDEAIAIIDELRHYSPNTTHPYIIGSLAMFRADENQKAFDYLEQGLAIDPTNRQLISWAIIYGIERDMREEAHRLLIVPSNYVAGIANMLDRILDPNVTLDDL
jgi:hypothetical protein